MPLITVKTVKQKSFKIEIEPEDSILVLKQKIATSQGEDEFPVCYQKLLFKGKILSDTSVISDTEISETGFVVVMVSKPKIPSTSTETTIPTPPITSTTTTTTSTADPSAEQGATALTTPPASQTDIDKAVESIMSMSLGYSRSEVKQALTICNNNVEAAANLLMSGPLTTDIPPSSTLPVQTGESSNQPTQSLPSQHGSVLSPDMLAQGMPQGELTPELLAQQLLPTPQQSLNPFEFLRSQPQFQELRQLIRDKPETLTQILGQINQANPQLYQLISSNPAEFRRLIQDDRNLGPISTTTSPLIPGGPSTQPSGGVTGPPGGGPAQIAVNPEEMEAINRLKSMGFPEHMVVQAYFACDKNEELAANFLLAENPFD